MPLHRRKHQLAYGLEATPGTALTLAATNCTTIIFNSLIDAVIPPTEREAMGSDVYHPSIPGARMANVSFMHHFRGSGTADVAPDFSPLLLASGLSASTGTSVVYAPVTGSTNACTIEQFQGGRKKIVAGAMFDLTINCITGRPIEFQYTGVGCWGGMTNAANLNPTYDDTPKPPRFASGTFTVGGNALKISQATITLGNQVVMREDPTTASGYRAAWISRRKVVVTLDPEAETTREFYADHQDITTGALLLVAGSTAGNILRIAAPVAAINNPPQDGSRNETEIDQLELLCCRNAADDSEITIAHE